MVSYPYRNVTRVHSDSEGGMVPYARYAREVARNEALCRALRAEREDSERWFRRWMCAVAMIVFGGLYVFVTK